MLNTKQANNAGEKGPDSGTHEGPYKQGNIKTFITSLIQGGFELEEIKLANLAYGLTKYAHHNIDRKDGTRYFEHVRSVCLILLSECGVKDINVVCTALMHDTVEDSWIFGSRAVPGTNSRETARWNLGRIFNPEVAEAVLALSKEPRTGDEACDLRNHHTYMEGIRCGNHIVHLVKMADRLHNLRCLRSTKPEFLAKQLKETEKEYLPLFREIADAHKSGGTKWAAATAYLYEQIAKQVESLKQNTFPDPGLAGCNFQTGRKIATVPDNG